MATYYIGQIVLFAADYAPDNFLPCDGRQVKIQDSPELYSLLGELYGGDGRTTFGLPDLRGRLPIGFGQGVMNPATGNGASLTTYKIADKGGTETVTLTTAQIPPHTHTLSAVNAAATLSSPTNSMLANVPNGTVFYIADQEGGATPTTVALGASAVGSVGHGLAHLNVMPTMALTYLICTRGLYPSSD